MPSQGRGEATPGDDAPGLAGPSAKVDMRALMRGAGLGRAASYDED